MTDSPRSTFSRLWFATDAGPNPVFSQLGLPGWSLSREEALKFDPGEHPAATKFKALGSKDDSTRVSIYMGMLTRERLLALKAFDAALGQPDPQPEERRDTLIEGLVDDYRLYGLSSGREHTEQLVRAFEDVAAAQAREQLKDQPQPDFSRLPFPVVARGRDAIKEADLRTHPMFAKSGGAVNLNFGRVAIRLESQARERRLARKAFDEVLGRPDPYPDESRDSIITDLAHDYAFLGVSSGKHHTEQLARVFEDAAAAQAREHLGKGR